MFYYAFEIHFEFYKEVSEEEYQNNISIPYNRHFPNQLHSRGSDGFSYVTEAISSKDQPYVDEELRNFVKIIYKEIMRCKKYLKEKECELSLVILYDDCPSKDDEDVFKGCPIDKNTIALLSEMEINIDFDSSLLENK